MDIRLANISDIEAILELQAQIYRTAEIAAGSKRSLEDQLKSTSCDVLVGTVEGKLVSCATLYYIEVPIRARPYAYLEGMVVDKLQRGQGLGTQMFNELFKLARKRSCYKFVFTSGNNREEAHNFYEKLGFRKWGLEFRMDL